MTQDFFAGKPVERDNFHQIYRNLELPWHEHAGLPEATEVVHSHGDLDALVQEVRQKVYPSIFMRCGTMRVLGMSQPIGMHDIYTNVNILEQISGRRRLKIADLVKVSVSDELERPGLGRMAQRMPGLQAIQQHSKLMVLGKAGAGKTTFLKHIALQCSLGRFQANRVPIFITLKDFAETERQLSLLEYVAEQLTDCGVTDNRVAEQLLSTGRALLLLDGLDEVRETDINRVLQEVHDFSARFHSNQVLITCRIAAQEYTFEQFTEVEVADFDDLQIADFATKWFAGNPAKGNKFIQKLKENQPIRELATNPLLLTLLCLAFADSVDFPSNRSELYREGIDTLLKKWDVKRNIEREQLYKKLSGQHKEDLLSQVALVTFERGEYFFVREELEQYITDYIRHLPDVSTDIESLQLDSHAVIRAIEAQHGLLVERAQGIYSFSHLTFQEYFTAKGIITSSNPRSLRIGLERLSRHVTENRWREVFLLTVGMLRNADYLLQLMKQQIDRAIVQDEHLQKFLTWLGQKSPAVAGTSKAVAVRAFYLDLTLGLDLKLDPSLSLALKLDPTLGLTLKRELELDRELDFALSLARTLDFSLARILSFSYDRELQRVVQHLKSQLPNPEVREEDFKKWWKANGGDWTDQLTTLQISCNDGHNWQFSVRQKKALQQYHDANKLLVDCLKSACYTTQAVRQELEETLLLPSTALVSKR